MFFCSFLVYLYKTTKTILIMLQWYNRGIQKIKVFVNKKLDKEEIL